MSQSTADIVICGAGIAGISAAYHLAVHHGLRNVLLVDERPPMSLTSDKSTEAYRNWWPGPDDAMLSFMNRSIDLLEQLDDANDHRLRLNRRGYLYATGNPAYVRTLVASAKQAEQMGAGGLRVHAGAPDEPAYVPGNPEHWHDQPDGADLFLDPALIRRHFPYLTPQAIAVLHARRCGWFSGQQLGMLLLEGAKAHGVRLLSGRVTGIQTNGGCIAAVTIATAGETHTVATPRFVNAAGPLVNEVGSLLGLDLPIFSELHLKSALEDKLGVVDWDVPLVILGRRAVPALERRGARRAGGQRRHRGPAGALPRRHPFPPRRRPRRHDPAAPVGLPRRAGRTTPAGSDRPRVQRNRAARHDDAGAGPLRLS